MDRRGFLISAGVLAMAGCATPPPRGTYEVTEVPAPTYRVGDRWTYRRTDGYNGLPRGTLTRKVTTIGDEGIRIVTQDEHGRVIDDALYQSPGVQLAGTFSEDGPMVGRCRTPYRRYDFPLVAGKKWQDSFYLDRTDLGGTRNYVTTSAHTEGWEDVQVGDRRYHALIVRRAMNLGQKSFWNGTLYRYETEWYVPALRGFARMHTEEEFYEQRNRVIGATDSGDRFIYELLSFELA